MCLHNGKRMLNGECDYHINPPEIEKDGTIVFDEPGRCSPQVNGTGGTDYHAFHFRYVSYKGGRDKLLVRHGGGQESFDMGYPFLRVKEILEKLDSDARFLMFHAFMDTHHDAEKTAREETAGIYKKAFVNGDLKKRKVRGQSAVKVWIEHKYIPVAA